MSWFLGVGIWKKERARQVLGLANIFFVIHKVALVLSPLSKPMRCSNLLLCHGQIFGFNCFLWFILVFLQRWQCRDASDY